MLKSDEGLKEYYRQYTSVSKVLVVRKVLSEVDHSRLFLIRLPK